MTGSLQSINDIDFSPCNEVFPSPRDWRDNFMYFLLVDRFDNNKKDIPAYDPASTPKGRDTEQGGRFQGGNLKGILRRLDYIKNLGCTAIWLKSSWTISIGSSMVVMLRVGEDSSLRVE